MNQNKISHPALIIWVSIAALLVLSSVKLPVIPYLNNYTHIDILKDLRADNKDAVIKKKLQPPVIIDGRPMATVDNAFDSSLIQDYSADATIGMASFYKKLNALKTSKGKVRIAYFGDSYIEADYITGELRSKLQAIYGGNGVGFIPMQSVVADNYVSIKFNGNTSWNDYNFHNNTAKYALGLTGRVFYSKGDSWSQYSSLHSRFSNVCLYTGRAADSATTVSVEKDGVAANIPVANDGYINKTILNNGTPVSKLKLVCANTNLPVYGISIEDTSGVYIDNYGFRGNTGLLTLQVQPEVMKGFQDYFKYDLIILHYGLNAINHGDTNYLWFDHTMAKLIEKIKANYPGIPVLLVSTSDVAYNEQGTYVTDPAVPVLVQHQQAIARNNKTAFWNLYNAMGGENTIANWVEGDTTYAYKDYMHVNEKGADKIAGIFLDKLLHSQKH